MPFSHGTTERNYTHSYRTNPETDHQPLSERRRRRRAYQRGKTEATLSAARAIAGTKSKPKRGKIRDQLAKRISKRAVAFGASRHAKDNDRLLRFQAVVRNRLPEFKTGGPMKPQIDEIPSRLRRALDKRKDRKTPKKTHSRPADAKVRFIMETSTGTDAKSILRKLRESLGFRSADEAVAAGVRVAPLFSKHRPDRVFEVSLDVTRAELGFPVGLIGASLKRSLPVDRFTHAPAGDVRRFLQHMESCVRVVARGGERRDNVDECCCCCATSVTGRAGEDSRPRAEPVRPTWSSIPDDTEWHLKQMRVKDAWELNAPSGSRGRGEGIVIAHPDTGWREHPEYEQANIEFDRARNVRTGEDGREATRHGSLTLPPLTYETHGTGTGAMIVGSAARGETLVQDIPGDLVTPTTSRVELSGVAPLAKIVPIRFTDTPVLAIDLEGGNFHRAIEHAIAIKSHVISLSVGGFLDSAAEEIINRAVLEDIIVVAAAGQYFDGLSPSGSVVEPGSFDNVIAVTGSTPSTTPWLDSHHGPNADIAAPGQGIWYPSFSLIGTPGIYLGQGTSFTAAEVAGVAAIWLSHWGRDNLRRQYSGVPLAHVFRHLLRKTAWRPPVWDSQWGPGIVDAHALLNESLPAPEDVIRPDKPDVSTFDGTSDLIEAIGGGAQHVVEEGLRIGGEIGDFIGEALNIDDIANGIEELMGMAEDFGGDVRNWAEEQVDELGRFLDDSVDAAVEIMDDLAEAGEDAAEAVGDFIEETSEFIDDAGEEAAELWDDAMELIGGLFGTDA